MKVMCRLVDLDEASAERDAGPMDSTPDRPQITGAEQVTEMLDRAAQLQRSAPDQAEHLTIVAEERASGHGLVPVRARALYLRARIVADQSRFDEALALIGRARDDWRRAGDELDALRTDLGRMQVLDDLGRHSEAIEIGTALITALDELDASPDATGWLRAAARENVGVAYGLTGQHDLALAAYAQAETEYRLIGMPEETARPLANRGVELLALGRPREAMLELRQAEATFEASGDRLFAAQCRGDIAQAHRQLGELADALRLLESARVILHDLGAVPEEIRLQASLAETCLALGVFGDARDHATAALTNAERTGMLHDAGLARLLIAQIDLGSGDHERAWTSLEAAAAVLEAIDDPQLSARVRLAQGEAALLAGWKSRGRSLLGEAIDLLRDGGWLIPLTWACLRQADCAEAVSDTESLLDAASALVEELRLPDLRYQLELRLGRHQRLLGHGFTAERHFRSAIEEMHRSSGALPDYVLLSAFRAERYAAYDELVDLLLRRDDSEATREACWVADEARARTLADVMAENVGSGPRLDVGSHELAEAFADLNAVYLTMQRSIDREQRAELMNRAEILERRVSQLRMRLVGRAPGRVIAEADHGRPTGSAAILTLAYQPVGSDLVAFVIDGDQVRATRISVAITDLKNLLEDLADQWSRVSLAVSVGLRHADVLLRSTDDTLTALYALLIVPIESLIPADTDQLRIIADGRLGAIPFHALFDGDTPPRRTLGTHLHAHVGLQPSESDRPERRRSGAGRVRGRRVRTGGRPGSRHRRQLAPGRCSSPRAGRNVRSLRGRRPELADHPSRLSRSVQFSQSDLLSSAVG